MRVLRGKLSGQQCTTFHFGQSVPRGKRLCLSGLLDWFRPRDGDAGPMAILAERRNGMFEDHSGAMMFMVGLSRVMYTGKDLTEC